MSDEVYTLGAWHVKEGMQDEFVEAWRDFARYARGLPSPPVGEGTLLQRLDEPQQFSSFGPWRSLDDIAEMRNHPDTAKEISKLMSLCEEGRPGTFRLVATG